MLGVQNQMKQNAFKSVTKCNANSASSVQIQSHRCTGTGRKLSQQKQAKLAYSTVVKLLILKILKIFIFAPYTYCKFSQIAPRTGSLI